MLIDSVVINTNFPLVFPPVGLGHDLMSSALVLSGNYLHTHTHTHKHTHTNTQTKCSSTSCWDFSTAAHKYSHMHEFEQTN